MGTKDLPPPEELHRIYHQEECPLQEIADKFNVCRETIRRRIKDAGLEIRTRPEALRLAYATGRHEVTIQSGENHWAWKGGKERRLYRNKIKKEKCEECGGRLNLGIHHKDSDHYNNDPENLQVLCVSCHMSLHKQAYWDAVKTGREPLRAL